MEPTESSPVPPPNPCTRGKNSGGCAAVCLLHLGSLNPAAPLTPMSTNTPFRNHGVAPEATSVVLYIVVLALVLFVALH